jgi:protein-S-isoprenylcysteine O-methyltransferase Ste14
MMRLDLYMRRATAIAGGVSYFVIVPGTIAGLVPWLITGWHAHVSSIPVQIVSATTIFVGLVPLVSAFVEFVKAGGTPSPTAAPHQLVVDGFNRYVRNPMYFGVLLVILGQALLFSSVGLAAYAVLFWVSVAAFVRWYEEPTLSRQFGEAYQAYRRAVPAWRPRLHPWSPER